MLFSSKLKDYWNNLTRNRKIATAITLVISILIYIQIILSQIIYSEPTSLGIFIFRILFWTFLIFFMVYIFLLLIKNIRKGTILMPFKSHHLYANILSYFFLIFLFKYFYDAIKSLTNLESVFTLTLTTILVYATLSLLSFTYVLILKNEEDDNLVKIDLNNDPYYKKSNNPEIEKLLITNKKKKLKNYQSEVRKSGESFLMATALSSIGFFMLYFAMIFTKITFKPDTILLELQEFFNTYISYLYYSLTVYILIFSLINFSRGLYLILNNLHEKFGNRFT